MNSKYLAVLLMIFGLLFALAQCGRLASRNKRSTDFNDDENDGGNDDDENDGDNDDDSNENDADLEQEKRAILNFLQEDEDASQFLDQSRRLLTSDQKSHMKEAKEKYEEKCERLLHPRYCPDLTTWPAWNQAYNSADGKK